MRSSQLFIFILLTSLVACGHKGSLYLPDKNEDNSGFGPIQTGIGLNPNKTSQHKTPSPTPPVPNNDNKNGDN
ncbi:MAG: hypothetical protein GKC53_04460 [Neisseriaceae bacterium]|nr:MAG: hypothetical protein GKC53_04460 [Neisseriaceae bacterium]